MRVNISGRGAPDGEGALPVRRSLWSYGHLLLRSAKLDPRAPRRRARSQRCIFVLDQGWLWASGTTDREDAIPPGAGSGSRRIAAEPCFIRVPPRSLICVNLQLARNIFSDGWSICGRSFFPVSNRGSPLRPCCENTIRGKPLTTRCAF